MRKTDREMNWFIFSKYLFHDAHHYCYYFHFGEEWLIKIEQYACGQTGVTGVVAWPLGSSCSSCRLVSFNVE